MLQALSRQVRGKGHRQQGDQNGLKVENTSKTTSIRPTKLKRHHQMFFSPLKMVSKIPSDLPVEKKTAEHGGDDARVVCRAGGEKRQESCRHNLRFEKLEFWLTI